MKSIDVYAGWIDPDQPPLVGTLFVDVIRGRESFRFAYSEDWLSDRRCIQIDPELNLYSGDLFPQSQHANFRVFMDSSPDRWGRLLMRRRESLMAFVEKREEKILRGSDFLLGVHDEHRMGGLRYKLNSDTDFVDNNRPYAVPPITLLSELSQSVKRIEKNKYIPSKNYIKDYQHWLNMLISPGSSLGGARPKACVKENDGSLWIAKFPSRNDEYDIAAWEYIAHQIAVRSGVIMADCRIMQFEGSQHTFLTRRFDRKVDQGITHRQHFSSAMTQLGYYDGKTEQGGGLYQPANPEAHHPASYIELAAFISYGGGNVDADLEQLWRRIVLNIIIKNTDDHLRNHGFLFSDLGWRLSPAYDINPNPIGTGLSLNIDESSNQLDLAIAMAQCELFRLDPPKALTIIEQVFTESQRYPDLAHQIGVPAQEIKMMSRAFMSESEKKAQLTDYYATTTKPNQA